jgi:hypothetical protein
MPGREFDAEEFVCDLDAGKYDISLREEIQKLSPDQLRAVAETLIRTRQRHHNAPRKWREKPDLDSGTA